MEIHTIGFTRKSASQFFEILSTAGIRRLIDIRLHNSGQLAGFTKQGDLEYFLRAILDASYHHEPLLTPSEELLKDWRAKRITWDDYERTFTRLLDERHVAKRLDTSLFDIPNVLLCSEATPEHCHRRLAAEYLQRAWGDVRVVHL